MSSFYCMCVLILVYTVAERAAIGVPSSLPLPHAANAERGAPPCPSERDTPPRAGAGGAAAAVKSVTAVSSVGGERRAPVVVANFNQMYKVTPQMLDMWINLLAHHNHTYFWQPLPLAAPASAAIASRLRARAAAGGVSAERVVVTNTSNIIEFVRRCSLADLVLDTSPIGAHTVAMDVLWSGTPLLTYPADSFSSRVASSVLAGLRLDGILCARSVEDARSVGSRLIQAGKAASGLTPLEHLRREIEHRRWSEALFSREIQVAHLETAFHLVYEMEQLGLPLHHIIVARVTLHT